MEFHTDINVAKPFPFKGFWVIFFIFILIQIKYSINKQYHNQTPRSVASDLSLHCLHMSNKEDAMLVWVKDEIVLRSEDNY